MTNANRPGIPSSEESVKEWEQTWRDMEECFELLEKDDKKKEKGKIK